jgi:single-stranded-DNA-specific exonuclease
VNPISWACSTLVALGTVADVAALHGLNRAFVAQGLKVLARRGNIGMAALIDASRLTRSPQAQRPGLRPRPAHQCWWPRSANRRSACACSPLRTPDEARAIAAQLSATQRRTPRDRGRGAGGRRGPDRRAAAIIAACMVLAGDRLAPRRHRHRRRANQGKDRQACSLVIALDGDTGKGSGRSISRRGSRRRHHCRARGRAAGCWRRPRDGSGPDNDPAPPKVDAFSGWLADRLESACRARASGAQRNAARSRASAPGDSPPSWSAAFEAAGPLRRGLARPAPRRRPGAARQGRHRRHRSPAPDRQRQTTVAASRPSPFRAANSALGQTLLHRRSGSQALAGRERQARRLGQHARAAELHLEDAAFAD